MPPVPLEYQGREAAVQFLRIVVFDPGHELRMLPSRANRQPALGMYVRDPATGVFRASGLLVLGLSGDRIYEITRFDNGVLAVFGLPRSLPA